MVRIAPHPDHGPQILAPLHGALGEERGARLLDCIVPDRAEARAVVRVEETNVPNIVVPELYADEILAPLRQPALAGFQTGHAAAVELLELIAVDRLIEEVGDAG